MDVKELCLKKKKKKNYSGILKPQRKSHRDHVIICYELLFVHAAAVTQPLGYMTLGSLFSLSKTNVMNSTKLLMSLCRTMPIRMT